MIKRALGDRPRSPSSPRGQGTPRRHGAKETIEVKPPLAIANVRIDRQAKATTFRGTEAG